MHGKCVATAAVFSGRPEPEWSVPAATARSLEGLWQQLEDSGAPPLAPPALGYRGCTLDCGSRGRWFAYGGLVLRDDVARHDPRREFERLLLECAPKGLIPPSVLAEIR